jgi:hypothetical protein
VNRYQAVAVLAGAAVLAGVPAGAGALTGVTGPGVTWGTAQEVPGMAALNTTAAEITAMSCASAGNCSAGGYSGGQVLVVSQAGGTWGKAEEVPGTAALDKGGTAEITSVSCGSAGNCSAGGSYADSSGHGQALVVSQVGGRWGRAEEAPGTAALDKGGTAEITSVSCAAAGDCSAGGSYENGGGQAFVISRAGGTWGPAEEVPGTATLSKGNAQVTTVSCPPSGTCSAGGSYYQSRSVEQPFVVSQTSP